MTTADALVSRLTTAGLGALGTAIFVGSAAVLPGGSGPYLSLVEYSGAPPVGTHNDGATAYRRPRVQIVARALDATVAKATADAAYAAVTLANTQVGTVWFLYVTPLQEPFDLGKDANNRSRYGFNVACMRHA